MCTMAAFAGERPAAPVLLEMLERQEGLWSGHFSGISTLCGGKVYTARVCWWASPEQARPSWPRP